MASELLVRFRLRQRDPRHPPHGHTSITPEIVADRKRLIRRPNPGDPRGFDSHHPLHFRAGLRRRQPTPARVFRARHVSIARSLRLVILSRAGWCRAVFALLSHAGGAAVIRTRVPHHARTRRRDPGTIGHRQSLREVMRWPAMQSSGAVRPRLDGATEPRRQ